MTSHSKDQADAMNLSKVESNTQGEVVSQDDQLRRDLKPRQVFMFSIACAIETGLIIRSGAALAKGGPGNPLIFYCLIGAAVFFVMTSLGEMAAFLPINKGFGGYATRIVDPAFGFTTGWNYFIKYGVVTPTNLTAAGLVIHHWRPDVNVAIWVTTFRAGNIIINFGLCRIIVMTTMILTCFIISLGGGPNHYRSGFHYWQKPGAFAQYLVEGRAGYVLGFWPCVCQALFAFIGCEVRILVFYIIGVLVLGVAILCNDNRLLGATKQATSAATSPFVVAVNIAGIQVLPDIINTSMLVFTLSAASSGYNAFIPYFKPNILVMKYIGTVIFIANITWWKLYKGTKLVRPSEVDVVTIRREFDELESPTDQEWNTSALKNLFKRLKK